MAIAVSMPVLVAEEKPLQNPALKSLYPALKKLFGEHYPEVTSHVLRDTIHFEHNTRLFVVHHALKTGEWQDPTTQRGPKRGGILCSLALDEGNYVGSAVVPQKFSMRYFTTWLLAPYSEKHDRHLYVHLHYPGDVDPEFLKRFQKLVNDFGQFLRP